ncbi:helix-turn-helix domain-containing protein [Cellulosimicrobium protaetiae]|uniref:Helix-turn-helix transcriptional regulator n=1 Tax=Cellulosimicrobium protaetiae TaxID=2587808 RepID=A0A6M5UGN8_9MICO|nr:helix-turn-helix domain-containing protein [Cellulosimicrobium protaetiae]QJW36772.1 helix-turn-helix transcriptional regulator [Cellulosimicrobium protaetiae]
MTPTALGAVVPGNSIRFLGHDTHEHDEPHLVHVVAGTAKLVVDGAALTLRAHENLWLAPHVPHSMRLPGESMALGPVLSPGVEPPSRVHRLGVVPAITSVLTAVMCASPATPEQVVPFRAALEDVLRGLAGDYFALTLPVHPVARAVAEDARRGAATLDELADRRRASARHVQRLFVEETGLAFGRWRTRAHLNLAVARLRGGSHLDAAARAAGYASRAGLLRALSRETGISVADLARDPVTALAAPRVEDAGGRLVAASA